MNDTEFQGEEDVPSEYHWDQEDSGIIHRKISVMNRLAKN